MNMMGLFDCQRLPLNGDETMRALALALGLCLSMRCWGQGTMQLRFEALPPGSSLTTGSYSESGMRFWNPYGPQPLVITGGGYSTEPENGTGYLQVTPGAELGFGFYTFPGTPFSLISFDAAEYLTNFPGPVSLSVVGYQGMDITVTNYFTTDGINDGTGPLIDFQTFHLDSQFVDLYRVEILSDRFSIDNVMIGVIPEPPTSALLLLGALTTFGWSWARRRRRLMPPIRRSEKAKPRSVNKAMSAIKTSLKVILKIQRFPGQWTGR
jgi:hypothetical protein